MANTRITDPEVLETRYPVRLERFSIRQGSGRKGLFNGGDGLIRQYRFLEDLHVSLLTQRRGTAPFGLSGGRSGAKGKNIRVLADDVAIVERAHPFAFPSLLSTICLQPSKKDAQVSWLRIRTPWA